VAGYLVRRLGWAVGLFLIVTLYTYVLFFLIPSSPVQLGRAQSEAESVDVRDALHVQGNIFQEYGTFLWRIVHLDLGESFANRREVTTILWQAAPVTASLVFGAVVVWLLIAFPIGLLSALRARSLLDRTAMVCVLIGVSAHPLWIGYLLSYYFGFKLGWLPINGYCDIFSATTYCGGPVQWAYHLVLPWTAFALAFAAMYARMIRASVLDILNEDYVRTARAKGLGDWSILKTHVLRNAMLPIVTMIGMDVSALAFAPTVFVERVFGLPGIGNLLFVSLQRHDLPVIVGIVVVVTTAILFFNLVVDLLYGVLDPRIRITGRLRLPRLAPRHDGEPASAPAPTTP